MEQQVDQKSKTIGIRATPQEVKLFEALAKEQGTTVSEFLRAAGLTIAEMSVENRELLGKNNSESYRNIQTLIKNVEETLANSIKESNTILSGKLNKVEKIIDAFLYAYLFHTPEVKDSQKQVAKNSAIVRKKKVLALIDENNCQENQPSQG